MAGDGFDMAVAACRAALGANDPARAESLALGFLETLGEEPRLRGIVGAARLARGDARAAIADFQLARAWGGDDADLYFALGEAWRRAGDLDEAMACWRCAIARDPGHADATVNATLSALRAGDWEAARSLAENGLAQGVADPRLPLWLGHALAKLHREAEAAIAYRAAVERAPGDAGAWFALALSLRDQRQFGAARAALARVLDIAPDHADAGFEAAQLDLMRERWAEGFALWDWRLRRRLALLPDDLPGRPWDGSVLPEVTLLLQAEQGLGDTLQFLRYAFLAARRVGRIVLRVHPPLVRLLDRPDLPWTVTELGVPAAADVHAPLLSLPRILGEASPRADLAAYLHSVAPRDPSRRRRVALVWAGSPTHHNDARRSCRFADFLVLRRVARIDFVHFQLDADRAAVRRDWSELADGGAGVADCLDTALRLRDCDLAICVDTAIAHLAGAMGLPVWVLVPFVADWRWGVAGSASPWYASARVWRQDSPGDWDGPLARIADALESWRDGAESGDITCGVETESKPG